MADPVLKPESKLTAQRVSRCSHAGWKSLEKHRTVRNFVMKEYAGPWYGNCYEDLEGRDDMTRRPKSLMKRLIETILPNIVGTEIRCPTKPKMSGLRGQAKLRGMLLDHTCEEIGLARIHRLVVMDAFMGGLGLYKIGTRAGTNIIKVSGENYDVGQFYVCRVDLDDFGRDPLSRDPDEDTHREIRYRVGKQFLLDSNLFDSDVVMNLPPINGYRPDAGDSDKVSGTPQSESDDAMVEQVELIDVLVYDGTKVLEMTIPTWGNAGDTFLMEPREYEGPERGPLIEMRPRELPNNSFPVSLCAQLLDLHLLEAALGTKMARRMLAQCRKTFWKPSEQDEAMEVGNGVDDELLKGEWNGQQADMGGVDQAGIAGIQQVTTWSNDETPNLQQTSGANDPNTKTATVGMIQQGNAQVRLGDMKNMANDALRRVVKCMAWDLDNDPFKEKKFSVRVPGGEMIDVQYDAAKKKGSFGDFLYDVSAVSEEPIDLRQKRAEFSQMMAVSIPWLTGIRDLGGDVAAGVRTLADEFNRPDLDEIFPTPDAQQLNQQYAMATQQPGPGQVTGAKVAGKGPSLPKPGAVRKPIDQRQADVAGAMQPV